MLGEVIRKRAVPEISWIDSLDDFSIKAGAITRFYPAGKPEVADRLTCFTKNKHVLSRTFFTPRRIHGAIQKSTCFCTHVLQNHALREHVLS